jgi:hypothetical protein
MPLTPEEALTALRSVHVAARVVALTVQIDPAGGVTGDVTYRSRLDDEARKAGAVPTTWTERVSGSRADLRAAAALFAVEDASERPAALVGQPEE